MGMMKATRGAPTVSEGGYVPHLTPRLADTTRYRAVHWFLVSGIAVLFLILGLGYLIAGYTAAVNDGPWLFVRTLVGSLRIHGALLVGCALLLGIGMAWGRRRRWLLRVALQVTASYALTIAILLFASWAVTDISFAAPWWYLAVSVTLLILLVLGAPTDTQPGPIISQGNEVRACTSPSRPSSSVLATRATLSVR